MNWMIDHRGPVARLTFSRPPENFMDFGSMIELGDSLEDLAAQPDRVKVIMLAGGVFINHADPPDLVKASEGRVTPQEAGSWARALGLLEEIPQPVIAAIDGPVGNQQRPQTRKVSGSMNETTFTIRRLTVAVPDVHGFQRS